MSRVLRYLSRCSAYLIALLLAAVWIFGAILVLLAILSTLNRHVREAAPIDRAAT